MVQFVIPALWIVWLCYWWLVSRHVKPTRWRESPTSAIAYRIPVILAVLLFVAPRSLPEILRERFLPDNPLFSVLGTLLVAAGLGFAVFARHYLGGNWSAQVVIKVNHSLVRTGPYRYVRHPIYTGILLAFVGTTVAIGEWRGVLAFGLACMTYAWKSKMEENRMRATFPEYEQYCQETAALVPFVF